MRRGFRRSTDRSASTHATEKCFDVSIPMDNLVHGRLLAEVCNNLNLAQTMP
jgi:hypothetical protein